ncbi:DNA-binding MarR family transcriptional regulator [Murinocardiopsis flavida]|uniref:DNA-binding MarR family transcriptional regulator n=1 Tax=Murinocardiopsis flavida TaxID=645275 RepID=A0A2P8CWP5_9ACTN|nr:MarR family transcriptional regulator [Murinocardiopsis flavida]PSK89402.1 DNA-binding MarR family transcriptional regulator [Murinocardiopsis flavida]
MATEPSWLSTREDRAWRGSLRMHSQLSARLNQDLLQDSGLSASEYEMLVVLSEHPDGRMPAQRLRSQLLWEKSRLSHLMRRMEQRGLIARESNPADARSAMVCLTPQGRNAITEAAPDHVLRVRQHFIDLMTPEELDIVTAISDRVLAHLAELPEIEDPADC